jgi:transcriptional regulator with XRE-family HTH domain
MKTELPQNILGPLFKARRQELGLSARQVCERLPSGDAALSRADLGRIEAGETKLADIPLTALMAVLDLSEREVGRELDKFWEKRPEAT